MIHSRNTATHRHPNGNTSGAAILTLTTEVPVPDPPALLRARILGTVAAGIHRYRQGAWKDYPGLYPWQRLRKKLGGRIKSERCRQAVDELLASGDLLEFWLAPPNRRDRPHFLATPGNAHRLPYPVARARGTRDAIAREGLSGLPTT